VAVSSPPFLGGVGGGCRAPSGLRSNHINDLSIFRTAVLTRPTTGGNDASGDEIPLAPFIKPACGRQGGITAATCIPLFSILYSRYHYYHKIQPVWRLSSFMVTFVLLSY